MLKITELICSQIAEDPQHGLRLSLFRAVADVIRAIAEVSSV